MKTQFNGSVSREGRIWVITFDSLSIAGQTGKLSEVDAVAKEILGLYFDKDPEEFEVTLSLVIPDSERELLTQAELSEKQAREALVLAAAKRKQAVRGLLSQGIPKKEVAELLGITRQRVSQLSKAS